MSAEGSGMMQGSSTSKVPHLPEDTSSERLQQDRATKLIIQLRETGSNNPSLQQNLECSLDCHKLKEQLADKDAVIQKLQADLLDAALLREQHEAAVVELELALKEKNRSRKELFNQQKADKKILEMQKLYAAQNEIIKIKKCLQQKTAECVLHTEKLKGIERETLTKQAIKFVHGPLASTSKAAPCPLVESSAEGVGETPRASPKPNQALNRGTGPSPDSAPGENNFRRFNEFLKRRRLAMEHEI